MSSASRSETLRTVRAWCLAVAHPFALAALLAAEFSSAVTFVLMIPVLILPVALLRRHPPPALMLMLSGLAVVALMFSSQWWLQDVRILQITAIGLAVGYVAAVRPRATSISWAALALFVESLVVFAVPRGAPGDIAIVLVLGIVSVWLVGNSVRQRRQYTEARRAQAEQEAVQAERLRIARELHDMIAHSIGVIAIQAGVG